MPAVQGSNPVSAALKKLGSAFNKHKDDETQMGFANLPGGIAAGIAEFTGAKIDLYKTGANQGKPYMSLVGVVKHPKEHNGIPIEGLQTRQRIDLFQRPKTPTNQNPKTEEEMVAVALNEMRKLGIETKHLNPDDWEDALNAHSKEEHHFRFRTVFGTKRADGSQPIYENWDGKVENFKQNGHVDAVQDNTGGEAQPANSGEVDWDAVAAVADDPNSEEMSAAQTQIREACEAAGISAQQIENAENWAAAVALMQEANAGGSSAEAAAGPASQDPEKGEAVNYKPPRARKSVECEVTAVFLGTRKCNIKASDGTMYKGISWEDLER